LVTTVHYGEQRLKSANDRLCAKSANCGKGIGQMQHAYSSLIYIGELNRPIDDTTSPVVRAILGLASEPPVL
jgi:hypothetical protein